MTGQPCPPSLRHALRREQPPVLAVDCPHCRATCGQPCHGPSGRRLREARGSRWETAGLRPGFVTGVGQREAS